jgi:predicted unusual protein kinase regulating ubiquinone biosynthesis (AarF/ABC1/UbiB family)
VKAFRQRYYKILWFFGWTLLGLIWWEMILPKIGFRRVSQSTRTRRMTQIAVGFRSLASQMGGVMIKVGQFLSSRLDVLPREITNELSNLQDEVAPESFEPIRALLEAEFGCSLEEKFSDFSRVPLASASIGQVYCAQAKVEDGVEIPQVVVKVQRPHIEEIVETDLAALKIVGRWIQNYPPIKKRANMELLLEEFSSSLYEELDYLHEGKNAEIFAENFQDDPLIRVPQVIWSHTTRRVLTLEDVRAIKISDYAAIEAAGIDREDVAERLINAYLKQVFEDGFFHADPHPGNLFVQPAAEGEDPGQWKLTFIDFGMTGILPEGTFNGLKKVLIAVGTQDAHRLVEAYQDLNVLLPGADLEQLERANQLAFESLWGKSTKEMVEMHADEAQKFVDEFSDLLYEMPFQIPENLILLGRCVAILSGMCSGLNPDFNIWNSLSPYATSLAESEGGGKWKMAFDEGLEMLRKLITLPAHTDALITTLQQGRLEVRMPALLREVEQLNRSTRKIAAALIFAAFLFSAVQLYLAGQTVPAIVLGSLALLTLLGILLR